MMTENEETLTTILDIGSAMIRSGAETRRVEDSLYRLSECYGFRDVNIWVVPSNIQATVTNQEGNCLSQIRYIRRPGIDFTRLDELNTLSRYTCAHRIEGAELRRRFQAIINTAPQKPQEQYLGAAIAGTFFGIFFHCDACDAVCACAASLLITFLSRRISRWESNPLILNFLISVITEVFIILAVSAGLGHHTGAITIGVIMLLISALGTTNGVRDLVHMDTLSGILNISLSATGAVGIALGIALPWVLLPLSISNDLMSINPDALIQILGCAVGCTGFALWFHTKRSHLLMCGIGAALTWIVYLVTHHFLQDVFGTHIICAAFCGVMAQVMARARKAPATIFQTISIFPVIPGPALYYTMSGIVTGDTGLALARGKDLFLVCFGIVLGFMAAEIITRLVYSTISK